MRGLFQRYLELQAYVGWSVEDAARVQACAAVLSPHFVALVDDFYNEIQRHPQARAVISGGTQQIERLKTTLTEWLRELFSGCYDEAYVLRRLRVGRRHVEIKLNQVYTNVALARLRSGLLRLLHQHWVSDASELRSTELALNKLIDLDLAIIEEAYQVERVAQVKKNSEAPFHSLVEAAPTMIVILRQDRTIAYFSPFAEVLTGCRSAEALGCAFETFLDEKDRPKAIQALESFFGNVGLSAQEWQIRDPNGGSRSTVWNLRRLSEYEGAPALLAAGQDVTELKLAQEQALQAERLAAIGQMMAALSHESGNALARSQASLEALALELNDRPDALELVLRVRNAQDHLRQLYEEVRNYASPLKLERDLWDVAGIWRQAWENLALKRRGRQAELIEQNGCANTRCIVDHFRLEQVFRNILDNAIAACTDPVRIKVTCQNSLLKEKPALAISFQDNGPGLNPAQRAGLFEPFYTTKTKGTGLGLAIARRIVLAHGGEIEAGSTPGGAELIVRVPRA